MFEPNEYANGNAVGESAQHNFTSSIDAAGTSKAVFVTTVSLSHAARMYADRSPKRSVLIGGQELARLIVKHRVGVRMRDTCEIKRTDEGYFSQEVQ